MVIHGEPPPWMKKVKFVGPRLDFEGSLYDDYDLTEPPLNFNLDDEVARRTEELIRDMYDRTLALLQRHHAALLKAVKVRYFIIETRFLFILQNSYNITISQTRSYFILRWKRNDLVFRFLLRF